MYLTSNSGGRVVYEMKGAKQKHSMISVMRLPSDSQSNPDNTFIVPH